MDLLVNVQDIHQTEIKIFPNPTTGIVIIEMSSLENVKYVISDVIGRQLKTGILGNQLDLSDMKDGLYLIQLYNQQNNMLESKLLFLSR